MEEWSGAVSQRWGGRGIIDTRAASCWVSGRVAVTSPSHRRPCGTKATFLHYYYPCSRIIIFHFIELLHPIILRNDKVYVCILFKNVFYNFVFLKINNNKKYFENDLSSNGNIQEKQISSWSMRTKAKGIFTDNIQAGLLTKVFHQASLVSKAPSNVLLVIFMSDANVKTYNVNFVTLRRNRIILQ